jgi:sulfur-oxidizing protein SoxY
VTTAEEVRNPLKDDATWAELKPSILGDITLSEGAAIFSMDAPYRAHDAATVPIKIEQRAGTGRITQMSLIVDENPAPVVAQFTFGEGMGELALETRVRVDRYSNVRAIATTSDGNFMTGRFVKASGGCSAPAMKDAAAAMAAMGKMKFRQFESDAPAQSGARREAQIMIKHPNYSGLQRNQVTQLFIEAHFIDELEVWQGDELLFSMEGGISVSEDPSFRFTYTENGAPNFRVRASDTEGQVFEQTFPKDDVAS